MLAHLLALLAPPGCVACGRALTHAGERLCADCTLALPWLRPGCPRCALPKHRAARCPAQSAAFPRAWSPFAYAGVARHLVTALKFRGALVAADLMASHLAANLPADLRAAVRGDAALVPAPGLAVRRRARGFDPARVIATALAQRLDCDAARCLARGDRTARQVGAGVRERRAPGRLILHVRGSPPRSAILIDDVHTSGATLDACAHALVDAGTTVVAAVTYARTL